MTLSIEYTATTSGNGKLLSEHITEFVASIPKEAELVVETKKAVDQRDVDKWTLTATWDGTGVTKPPIGVSYPPGVRSGGAP